MASGVTVEVEVKVKSVELVGDIPSVILETWISPALESFMQF